MFPQKRRVTSALDRKLVGTPAVNRKVSCGTVSQATETAPIARRQSTQWQTVSWNGRPSVS